MVLIRDASGAARAQVVVTHYRVGAPARRPGRPLQPPGLHVREIRGFLVVP